jgi:hypothetical protein
MTIEQAKIANRSRWTILHDVDRAKAGTSAHGVTPETWLCVDCGTNTAPGIRDRKHVDMDIAIYGQSSATYDDNTEVYHLREEVWKNTGMEQMGGCLCIGCVEKRIGRRLKPKDFADHVFNSMPCTPRLRDRRGGTPGLWDRLGK